MAIGTGIVLIIVGLILLTNAITLPSSWLGHIQPHPLGTILIVGGIAAIVASWIWATARRRRATYVAPDDRPDVF